MGDDLREPAVPPDPPMAPSSARPLLLIDVDGPLNRFAGGHRGAYRAGYRKYRMGQGHHLMLHPGHGRRLAALPFDLVWATTWEHEADQWIAPLLGLPPLPVIEWPDGAPTYGRVHFKTPTVVDFASGRPFAWVDDEVTDEDRRFVAEHHAGPALLHHVDPAVGLADDDFAALAEWAGRLGAPGTGHDDGPRAGGVARGG
ncbi:hypothetical protein ACFO4E_23760 [Nocardiopsis mangrovi]|uniref:Secreted protein n=1 Tax=Nocardiopsis mangrovi TaxID=1179818 RepID=A0ABV9E159_9ACTN